MLGKNQMQLVNEWTECFKEELIEMFKQRGDKPFGDLSFYIEMEYPPEEAEKAYQQDMMEKELNDLRNENKLLRAEVEERRKEAANKFFKEMGVLNE